MSSTTFQSLGVRDELAEVLRANGIVQPTPIQREAIPYAAAGTDLIAEAQTGTGKTLAFALPMLERINPGSDAVQGLILTPTRELAIQITAELKKLAPAVGARVLAAYGGQDVERQLRKLEGAVHLVVATPGRLLDHLRRGSISLGKLKVLVLDEADQMLHMGFLPEVEAILAQTPARRQTLLFSATMPQQVRQLAQQVLRNPQEVRIRAKQVTLSEIKQIVVQTTDRAKQDDLCKLIDQYRPYLAVVFCRTKRRASTLNQALQERGYAADELHGDLSQAKREQVMKRFREAKLQLLVATDVAARGLDVEGVTHVFNYDIPPDAESYIHRIGRTGRAGQTGMAVTFAAAKDRGALETIERGIRMTLPRRKLGPDAAERDGAPAPKAGRANAPGPAAGRKTVRQRPQALTQTARARDAAGAAPGRGAGKRGAARGDARGGGMPRASERRSRSRGGERGGRR
ncbi:DEAD-box ATP-dependent RNA helicase CshA [Paenibacillus sp. CECT 9249]|uniref:DEAD/DEAH box helicase n=1 Tax=Paenibacillus sp. CECT 9249 TaxID=2845385 RepID=UPI001EF9BBB3|nr:DEAD-box ATP-dependent RNA helicase CshA [Paenibacillus sp. CECT 9249]